MTLSDAVACPCGDSQVDLKADHRGTFVQCESCYRVGPRSDDGQRPLPGSEHEAVELWNDEVSNADDSFPVELTCAYCGFSLTVTEEDASGVPGDLSPQYRARIVLEDHGWSNADDPPLCSSCS